MLYGTIMRCSLGFQIKVGNFDTITYNKHTVREAKARYRRQFKLVNRKIIWGGNLSCFG